MSISLDKLKALRKQAGASVAPAPATEPVPTAPPAVPATATDTAAQSALRATLQRRLGGSRPPARPPRFVDCDDAPKPPIATQATVPPTSSVRAGERSVLDWVERDIRHTRAPIPATPLPPPARTLQPRNVDALKRLLGPRQRMQALAPAATSGPVDRQLPGVEVAPGLHVVDAFLPQPMPAQALSLAFAKRPEDQVAPENLLFFDTETTGLAGGTGTRAFMIGAANWQTNAAGLPGLRVRQLLIATMGAERAMLELFASWLQPHTVLCSYNGRSYDAPLLKTRYRLARLPEPLSALDHVDLLYPTRRQWRGVWENCRLATIEHRVLGIVREDDLPGAQAPAAWLSYLRGGSARNVRRVGAHNHQDVVTLAQLFLRLVHQQDALIPAPIP